MQDNAVFLTFYHDRNIFDSGAGSPFKGWIRKHFQSVKYEGAECGRYIATISVSITDFEAGKDYIPTTNLVRFETKPSLLEWLAFNLRPTCNERADLLEKALAEFNTIATSPA